MKTDEMPFPETPEEALDLIANIAVAFQKCRSDAFENFEGPVGDEARRQGVDAETFFAGLFPWIFGEQCLLPTLSKIAERGSIASQELFNILYICNRPENASLLNVWFLLHGDGILPDADLMKIMQIDWEM